ncbi:MAG: ferritin-like domain-containing protein [Phycisphaeraceae bacterium]|nr:ferritin-like domain-containing protein [Phycisphaeraceae bacterium]
MKIMTLEELYLDQLRDMHSSERQIIKALPKMVKSANHEELKAGFNRHLAETKEHLARLDRILKDLGKSSGRKVCQAAKGLIEEGADLIHAEADEEVRDAGLICAAQKIEHYEIASYGCLRTFARLLEREADAELLDKTLDEEKSADQSLTDLAVSVVNAEATA